MAEAEEKNQELRIEKIRGTVNPADLMMRHLDEQMVGDVVVLAQHQTHRRSTEFMSGADDGH